MTDAKYFHKLSDVETILVGVDLSQESKELVKEAQWLSKIWGAELVLINVRPLVVQGEGGFGTPTLWDEDLDEAKREIRRFYMVADLGIKVEVRFGDAAKEINVLSAEYSNPLVLVAHSRKSTWEKILSGSASKDLATKSRAPVLIF